MSAADDSVPAITIIPAPQIESDPLDEPADPLADVIRRIHAGEIDPAALDADLRRRCVHHLTLEGFTTDDIIAVLHISERTVKRDRAAARKDHAVAPRRELGDELLGEFQSHTLASIARLTRLANSKEAPAFARLWAEESIGRIYHRFLDMARRLNYFRDGEKRLRKVEFAEEMEREARRPKTPFEQRQDEMFKAIGFRV